MESYCFDSRSRFINAPYGVCRATIGTISLTTSKNTGYQMIEMTLTMPSIDLSDKYAVEIKVPTLYFIIDINAEKLKGSSGYPMGVEKLAALSFKCFKRKLKKTENLYTGLYTQLKEYEGQDILILVKHKLVLAKKNGLAEFNRDGKPVIRRDAEIMDYSSIDDEEFKKRDDGQPYLTGLTPQETLLIEKSKKWEKLNAK